MVKLSSINLSSLPVISKDLADSWIHGAGTYPKQVRDIRQTRNDTIIYELLSSLSENKKDFEKYRNSIYDNLSIFSEHTWGLDVKTWLSPNRVYDKKEFLAVRDTKAYKYMEESWQEQVTRSDNAVKLLSEALDLVENADETSIVNPNAWEYTGWVRVNKQTKDTLSIFSQPMIYAENLKGASTSPLSKIHKITETSLNIAKDNDQVSIQNHRYKVVFSDTTGEISEVFDKELGEAILKSRDNPIFGYQYGKYGNQRIEQYLEDYGKAVYYWGIADNGRENYPKVNTEYFSPVFLDWKVEGSNLVFNFKGAVTEEYGDSNGISIIITLPPIGEELFLEVILEGKQATPMVESASIILPLPWDKPNYTINKNGFELDPATDIMKGANHAFYCLESYVKAEGDTGGICIVSHDTPLMSIGETGVYTFRKEYEEHQPEIHFNLFNNMWGTNFPQWIEGDFSFRYTIFGYKKGEDTKEKAFSSWQIPKVVNSKVYDCPVDIPKGFSLLAYRPSVTNGHILELLEIEEIAGNVDIKANGYSLQKVDLYERPLSDVFKDNINISVNKNDIVTIHLSKPELSN